MTKKFTPLLIAAGLTVFNFSAYASDGIFGSGVELNANGTVTLYGLDNNGGTRLKPTGSTATLDTTSWANGSDTAPVLDLGTFDPTLGQTLSLKGGALLTFKNGGSDVTGAFLDFRIFPTGSPSGSFTEFSLPFNEDNVAGNSGDQRWASETQNVNLLTGLSNGSYELSVFLRATRNDGGDLFSSQSGANYAATFEVVPEPSTWLAGAITLGALLFLRRRRKVT